MSVVLHRLDRSIISAAQANTIGTTTQENKPCSISFSRARKVYEHMLN